jgi:hypothetical protein
MIQQDNPAHTADLYFPVATDVVYCPDIFSLAHYVIFKIKSANNGAIAHPVERRKRCEIFINLATLSYNLSHQAKDEQIKAEQLSEIVQLYMECDEQDSVRFRVIPQ